MGGIFTNLLNSIPVLGALLGNGYRPAQWSSQPQIVSITANIPSHTPGSGGSIVSSVISFDGSPINNSSTNTPSQNNASNFDATTYYFDAILNEDHVQELRSTEHPVQNGAAISDHAYLIPSRVTLEIGVSDAMDSYKPGQYSNYGSKSVSVYQTLLYLQRLRVPLVLTTRLNTYQNMLIELNRAHEDVRTLHGLRATISMKQIFMGEVGEVELSGRPNQSISTSPGASGTLPIPQNIQQYQNAAGQWSSNIP